MATVIVKWGVYTFSDITEVKVHRSLVDDGIFDGTTEITTLAATSVSYEDVISPVEQDTYYYAVEAVRPEGSIITNVIPVLVVDAAIETPIIATASFDGTTNILSVSSSTFSANVSYETHQSSEWEVWSSGTKKLYDISTSDLESIAINIPDTAEEEWVYTEHTNRIADLDVDSSGNVYSASYDTTIRKINQTPSTLSIYTGTDYFSSVAVGSDGSIYAGNWDGTVIKLPASGGTPEWTFSGHTDAVLAVSVDASGFVYSGSRDNTVKKISPTGTEEWTFSEHTDQVTTVIVDGSGNVYSSSLDTTVKKISPTGTPIWTFSGHTVAVGGIGVDDVTGEVYTGAESVKKLNSDGVEVWSFSGFVGAVLALVIDDTGVYIGVSEDVMKVALDGSGIVWTFSGFSINVYALAIDSSGHVYAGGGNDTIKKINQPADPSDLSVRVKYIGSSMESEWSTLYVV